MPIPESQLTTWSNQGAVANSAQAYARIKAVLDGLTGSPAVYLQGSYANSTNIYGNSDVDIVAEYEGCFHRDISALSAAQQALYLANHSDSDYTWHKWRGYVHQELQREFGTAVSLGNKAIRIALGGTKPADVLPALPFKKYHDYSVGSERVTRGIQFFNQNNTAVINYPKQHIENGVAKNSSDRTAGRYKPTVRVFKNLRECLVTRAALVAGKAPSYFLECALSNVPDAMFVGSLTATVPRILTTLNTTPFTQFRTQNGQSALFGSSPTQWDSTAFSAFLLAATHLWANW